MKNLRRGFTLIELLVVIAIIAILSLVVILTLNPAELLKQGRDSNRLSDLGTLKTALASYLVDQPSASLGGASTTYASVPDSSATCANSGLPALPSGWSYHCAPSSTLQKVDGTGWLPLNLASMTSGSPVVQLPVDPINGTSTKLYYTYTPGAASSYELTAALESSKYGPGGSADRVSTDGGSNPGLYEVGSSLALYPIQLPVVTNLAVWLDASQVSTLTNGSATSSWTDMSGNGNNANQLAAGSQPTFRTAVLNSKPVFRFDGVDDAFSLTNPVNTSGVSFFMVAKWNALNNYSFAVGLSSGTEGYFRNNSTGYSLVRPDSYAYSTLYQNGIAYVCQSPCALFGNQNVSSAFYIYSTIGNASVGRSIKWFGQNESNNSSWWSGDIAEVIIYSSALTDSQRQTVERYLGAKYGITVP